MCGIYKITNKVNGKMYIGKTKTTFKKRWYCHKYELRKGNYGCRILQRAWTKYGEENFEFSIIAEGNFSSQELKELEEIFIKLYGHYNIQKVSKVLPQSKEHKEKLSKATKAKWADPEHRAKRLEAMKSDAWSLYPQVVEFWRNKANGRGGHAHPGKVKLMKEFNLTRQVAQSMIKKMQADSSISIIEGYNKEEIYKYWSDCTNANQAKYKHPGRRDLSKTFGISDQHAEDLIKEFQQL